MAKSTHRADLKYIIGFETSDAPLSQSIRLMKLLRAEEKSLRNDQKNGLISMAAMNRGLKEVHQNMKALRTATGQGARALNKFESQLTKSGKATRRFELGMQQGGYQVQDFIVQVQGGTNPLVAFSQQASQLAGFFAGPWGAMIGLGIAALSGLAMAFSATGRAARESKKEIEEAIKAFETQNMMAMTGLDKTQIKLGEETTALGIEHGIALTDLINAKKMGAGGQALDALILEEQKTLKAFETKRQQQYDYTEARNKNLRIMADANARAAAKSDQQSGMVSNMDSLAEEFKRRQEYEESLKNSLSERARISISMFGKEGEAALIEKQRIEYDRTANQLKEEGLSLEGETAQAALYSLKLAQNMELGEYRRVKAIQDRAKADSEAQAASRRDAAKSQEELRKTVALLREQTREQKQLAESIGKDFGDAFTSIVDGTSSVKDAFSDMARSIIKQLFDILVVQQLVGGFSVNDDGTTTASGIVGAIMGGTKSNGGPVEAGKTYLVGERGPETFTAPSNGKIYPTESLGGGVTVVQNFSFSANGDESVKRIIAQEAPKIADMTTASIMDQRRRGGSMRKTFG